MPRASRRVLPGYPKEGKFDCREELGAYLSGDKIVCLRCGQGFKILETHLRNVHDMSGDEYREIYGIPYTRGLCSSDFSERRVEMGKALFTENKERQTAALTKAHQIQEKTGYRQRGKPGFWKKERTKYTHSDYVEFLRRHLSGRTVNSVSNDIDMPHYAHVSWYMKRSKEFATLWDDAALKLTRSEAAKLGIKNSTIRKAVKRLGANPEGPIV